MCASEPKKPNKRKREEGRGAMEVKRKQMLQQKIKVKDKTCQERACMHILNKSIARKKKTTNHTNTLSRGKNSSFLHTKAFTAHAVSRSVILVHRSIYIGTFYRVKKRPRIRENEREKKKKTQIEWSIKRKQKEKGKTTKRDIARFGTKVILLWFYLFAF